MKKYIIGACMLFAFSTKAATPSIDETITYIVSLSNEIAEPYLGEDGWGFAGGVQQVAIDNCILKMTLSGKTAARVTRSTSFPIQVAVPLKFIKEMKYEYGNNLVLEALNDSIVVDMPSVAGDGIRLAPWPRNNSFLIIVKVAWVRVDRSTQMRDSRSEKLLKAFTHLIQASGCIRKELF